MANSLSGSGVLGLDDELAKLYGSPIQKNFPALLSQCDPRQITDTLFAKEVIETDDLERVSNKQRLETRRDAAEVLFIKLVERAKRERSMRVVNALVETLDELEDVAMKALSRVIAASRRQALAKIQELEAKTQRARTGAAESPRRQHERDQWDSIDETDVGCRKSGGDDAAGSGDVVDMPERGGDAGQQACPRGVQEQGARALAAPGGGGPEDFQYAALKENQLRDIAEVTRDDWLRLARYLPDKRGDGYGQAFKLSDWRLDEIKKKESNFERMLAVFDKWVGMTPAHNCGVLYKFLHDHGYGTVAEKVLARRSG